MTSTIVEEGMDEAKVLLEGNFLIGLGRRELDGKVGVLVAQSVLVIFVKSAVLKVLLTASHIAISLAATNCFARFQHILTFHDHSPNLQMHFDFVGDVQLSSSCFMIGQRQSTTASSGSFHCHH